jgi:hypothetical protein
MAAFFGFIEDPTFACFAEPPPVTVARRDKSDD